MPWLKTLFTSKRFALLEAENGRLLETNLVLEKELAALKRDNRALINMRLKQSGDALPDEPAEQIIINRVRKLSLHQRQREYAIKTDPRAVKEPGNG